MSAARRTPPSALLEFWEFGIGSFIPLSVLTGGADNEFETFTSEHRDLLLLHRADADQRRFPPVNSFGAGGLYESQFANSSSQLVLSPKDSLSGETFNEYNGSTSI